MSYAIFIIILSFTISNIIAAFIIPQIFFIAFKKQLFDIPNSRTVHKNAVPRLGGVSFFPAILLSMVFASFLFSIPQVGNAVNYISVIPQFTLGVCALIIMYFVGIADDLISLRYREKFVAQILSAALIVGSGLYLDDFQGILGIYKIPAWLGIPFTVILIVYIINSINLIDGIDGLSSGLCGIAFLFFGFIFFREGKMLYSVLSFISLGAILPFYYYNTYSKKRKIFMGDTGAYTLGIVCSILILSMCSLPIHNDGSSSISMIVSISLLAVPLFDMARVMLYRLRHKRHIFKPDNNHIHHRFLALGMTHRQARLSIFTLSISIIIINIILDSYIKINTLLAIDIIYFSLINILIAQKIIIKRKHS